MFFKICWSLEEMLPRSSHEHITLYGRSRNNCRTKRVKLAKRGAKIFRSLIKICYRLCLVFSLWVRVIVMTASILKLALYPIQVSKGDWFRTTDIVVCRFEYSIMQMSNSCDTVHTMSSGQHLLLISRTFASELLEMFLQYYIHYPCNIFKMSISPYKELSIRKIVNTIWILYFRLT